METSTTLLQFEKKEETFEIKSEIKIVEKEEIIDKFETDKQVLNIVSQIKNIGKLLITEYKISEEESYKIAFYSFLKKISQKQNQIISISEYDNILSERNFNFHFNIKHFLQCPNFLEKIYSKSIPIGYKKNRGQFFTPIDIAEFMANIGLKDNPKKVLDPALGGGIFISTLNHITNNLSFTTVEKDPLCLAMAKINLSRYGNLNLEYKNMDFLDFNNSQYDLIIANPPYVRFHDIENRDETISKIETEIDSKLSRLINYYALFFFKAKNLLKEGGKLIFITPSEFLNVNYGTSVKEYFKKNYEIDSIITFENGALVFEDNLSTACITVLTRKNNPDKNKKVKLIKLSKWIGKNDLIKFYNEKQENYSDENISLTLLKQGELNYKEKWLKYFNKNEKFESCKHNLIKLSDIAFVNRGIATGANNYFLFSNSKFKEWNLEEDYFKPVIAKSNFCKFIDFTNEDFENLIFQDKSSHLLYCFSEPSQNLKKFIEHGEKQNLHKRYLTSKRTPWYSMEKRDVAPIWAGVFSRDGVKFILNKTNCLNLTTFHAIYPNFNDENKLLFLVAFLNSEHCKELIKREMRSYGGGLNKFEPKDLENIPVPDINNVSQQKIDEIASLFEDYLKKFRTKQDISSQKMELENEFEQILNA
ncbi:MAG: SAM-dependent methyltransferase [Nanoarchaeota archaeon]|nr:SAM-dependent methyltransferase [Nanoarchaeota archaeon]